MYPLGFGIFHSGIEVNGVGTFFLLFENSSVVILTEKLVVLLEYAYGGHELDSSGIFQMAPKQGIPGLQFRYCIVNFSSD